MSRLIKRASSPQTGSLITYDEVVSALRNVGHEGYAKLTRNMMGRDDLGNRGFFGFTPATDVSTRRFWVVDFYQFGSSNKMPHTVAFAKELDELGAPLNNTVLVHEFEDGVVVNTVAVVGPLMFKDENKRDVKVVLTTADSVKTLINEEVEL